MASVPIREEWAGRTIGENFRLMRWLGGSESCGVFLAEWNGKPGERFAIKLMPAEAAEAEDRPAGWEAARELEGRHLLRVFEQGRCHMDGAEFAYVVTEYAPEVLAEVLPERALSTEEVLAVLEPLMDGLEYLHGLGLVHGHLKPSNIMADGNELKLAVDHVMRVGEAGAGFVPDAYDAPELQRRVVTPAADVWSLGMSLVQMLTQKRPELGKDGAPVIPDGMPEPFARIARECLQVEPAQRWGLKRIRAWLRPEEVKGAAAGAGAIAKAGSVRAAPVPTEERAGPEKPSGMALWIKLLIVAVAAVVVLIGFLMWMTQREAPVAPETPAPPQPVQSESAPAKPAAPPVTVNGAVAERVPPEVLQSALGTIRGTLVVDVQVTVGPDGRVAGATFADHGPSRYFAKASMKAARQWRFRPATVNGRPVDSAWLLRFAYTNEGDEVTATEVSP